MTLKTPLQIPELLAPAGNYDCMQAAIENGADAVYFGLATGFNARARAANFDLQELQRCMTLLHQANVKGYVTLNTLVFPEEIAQLESIVRTINDAGVDAVLLRRRLLRRRPPHSAETGRSTAASAARHMRASSGGFLGVFEGAFR